MPLSADDVPNRFMQGPPTGVPQPMMPPQRGMGGPPAMGGMPPQPGPPPSPEQVQAARDHMQKEFSGLRTLAEKPNLTKKDVFSAVSDMIAKGVFPTQSAKQELIAEMAKLPDDEMGLRKAIGARLFAVATMMGQLDAAHGTGDDDANQ